MIVRYNITFFRLPDSTTSKDFADKIAEHMEAVLQNAYESHSSRHGLPDWRLVSTYSNYGYLFFIWEIR